MASPSPEPVASSRSRASARSQRSHKAHHTLAHSHDAVAMSPIQTTKLPPLSPTHTSPLAKPSSSPPMGAAGSTARVAFGRSMQQFNDELKSRVRSTLGMSRDDPGLPWSSETPRSGRARNLSPSRSRDASPRAATTTSTEVEAMMMKSPGRVGRSSRRGHGVAARPGVWYHDVYTDTLVQQLHKRELGSALQELDGGCWVVFD